MKKDVVRSHKSSPSRGKMAHIFFQPIFYLILSDFFVFQLNSDAFGILKVSEHNYDEVDNLTLDNNLLESFPEKLLDMKLKLSFSAKSNQLTSVRVEVVMYIEYTGCPINRCMFFQT